MRHLGPERESSSDPSRGSIRRFAHTRAIAVALLLVQGTYLGYGASPFMSSRCACEHGPEVPCDCPHHVSAKGKDARPCQLHRKATSHAQPSPESAIRVRCGAKAPDLTLLAWVTFSSEPPTLPLDYFPPEREVSVPPPDVPASPPRPPPKARV